MKHPFPPLLVFKCNATNKGEAQEYLANILFPSIAKRGGKKMAVIISSDIFAQVSIEQIEMENKHSPIEIKYFDIEKDGVKWLKQ